MDSKDSREAQYGVCKLPLDGASFPDSSQSFYRPLSRERREIRLLIVEQGLFDDPIYCQLRHGELDLEVLPDYETISYCWGDSRLRGWLSVNDTIISVPFSSEQTIRRMRLPDRSRTLWIDSVCINQSDLREKSSQITLMSEIYRFGATNLIYLGEDEDQKAEAARSALKEFCKWYEKILQELSTAEIPTWEDGTLKHIPREFWARHSTMLDWLFPELYDLFSLQWFRRVWVVQEAQLAYANVFIWGDIELKFSDLRCVQDAFDQLDVGGYRLPKDPTLAHKDRGILWSFWMQKDWRLQSETVQPRPFLHMDTILRLYCRTKLSSEPRDYVFGLLAYFQKRNNFRSIPELLEPDYSKSIADVFRDATRYIIEEQATIGGMTVLELIHHRPATSFETDGFCSWAVEWDTLHQPFRARSDLNHAKKYDSASGLTPLEFLERSDPAILTLNGVLAADITVFGGTNSYSEDNIDDLLRLIEFLRSNCTTSEDYESPEIEDEDEIVAEVMAPEGVMKSGGYTMYYSQLEVFKAFVNAVLTTRKLSPEALERIPDCEELATDIYEFSNCFLSLVEKHRFFSTDTGHIGLGPPFLRNGDIVAMFEGEDMPMMLRPFGEEYRLLGMAYIYGLTHDEVSRMGLSPQWIDLR